MKTKLLLIALFAKMIVIHAQTLAWVNGISGPYNDYPTSVALDELGNVYTIGIFDGTADFDPSDDSSFLLTSNGYSDIFIQKLDPNGNLIWAKSLGGAGDEYTSSITIDNSGNLCIIGNFNETMDFDPNEDSFELTSTSYSDIFVLKLTAEGTLVWAKSFGGVEDDIGEGITTDSEGNIYTSGWFYYSVDFDPNDGTNIKTSMGSSDFFIQKLSSTGELVWVHTIGGTNGDNSRGIVSDGNGNIYITGSYRDEVDFDPGVGSVFLEPEAPILSNPFILKLDTAGNFIWAKNMLCVGRAFGIGVTVDAFQNVLFTGHFEATLNLDPATESHIHYSNGGFDVFIEKLNRDGEFIWGKTMGGIGEDYGRSIATDATGNVYTAGSYAITVDFDPDIGVANSTSAGNSDIFLQKLNSEGEFNWVYTVGGVHSDKGKKVKISHSGNIHFVGFYTGGVDFSIDGPTVSLSSGGGADGFIEKIENYKLDNTDQQSSYPINLYPNPNEGIFQIDLPTDETYLTISIFNNLGEIVYESPIQQERIDISHLPNGLYYIQLNSESGIQLTTRIVLTN